MIKLGQKVRDKITQFEGVAMARCEYLTGCTQIGVSPRVNKDGVLGDTHYFDYTRLEIVDENPITLQQNESLKVVTYASKVGGPNRDAPKT